LSEIDQRLTIKTFGYTSIQDYYKDSSSKNKIVRIKVPFLILNSLDDPLLNTRLFNYVECLQNPNVIFATTQFGGHLAWYKSLLPARSSWMYDVVSEWCRAVRAHHSAAKKI
jgi:predicted alpha/beta-fold hydrolase